MSNCCMRERTCTLTMIDPETNKEIGSFSDISEIDFTRNTVEECYDNKEHKPIITKDERVLSFRSDMIEARQKLISLDPCEKPSQMRILAYEIVQARKHHKKRINKKWLKRYGYKKRSVDLGEWNYRATDNFGEYEFERMVIGDVNPDSTSKRI